MKIHLTGELNLMKKRKNLEWNAHQLVLQDGIDYVIDMVIDVQVLVISQNIFVLKHEKV